MKRTSAFLAVSVLMLGFLLACLVLVAGRAPVRADEPEQDLLIPRHRVGHRAKVQNLDTLLALNAELDPLFGNRRLVEDDEIVVAYSDGTNTGRWTLGVEPDLAAPSLMTQGYDGGFGPAAATGDFNGDALEDFVVLRVDPTWYFWMDVGYIKDGVQEVKYTLHTGEWVYAGRAPKVATGDLDGDGQDEIVIAWVSGGEWVNLKVYDPQGTIQPVAKCKRYDEQMGNGNFDVATGDFDGDGNDDVVLAWSDLGNWTAVKLYDVGLGHTSVITPGAKLREAGDGRNFGVASGQFDGDIADEIAVTDGSYIRFLKAGSTLQDLSQHGTLGELCVGISEDDISRLATGDFDVDGRDELVHSCHSKYQMYIRLFTVYANLSGGHQMSEVQWPNTYDPGHAGSLAVGDLNKDMRPEIVLGRSEREGDVQHNYLEIYEVTTDLGHITAKGQLELPQTSWWEVHSTMAVAVGDLDGDSVRVGLPTYQRVTDAKELLVVINEPPKHKDIIGDVTYDLNVDEEGRCTGTLGTVCTLARYEKKTTVESEMTMSTRRDWGLSEEFSGEFEEIVEASLKLSYGQGFEKTTGSIKERTFGQEVEAGLDDAIIRTETTYDVWEYPVYSDTTGLVEGHIAVVFPVKILPKCKKDCDVLSTPHVLDGGSTTAHYSPNHEHHNVLSYSPDPPDDIGTLIKGPVRNSVGPNNYNFWVEWKDVEEDEEKRTESLGVELGAGVHAFGIKADVEGTYEQEQVSTHKVSWEQSTAIHVYFHEVPHPDSSDYTVDSYIYWDSEDQHLALDYAAWPEHDEYNPNWWDLTYTLPDPAFNLPWKYEEIHPLLSREITFDPRSPTAGDLVTITAKVRNYSQHSTNKVEVRFYAGDPDAGGPRIGTTQMIQELAARSSQTVKVQFDTSGHAGEELHIYAVVDPDHEIEEVHDEKHPPSNNKAYATLPVKPVESPPMGPVNVRVTAEGIAFGPEAPVAGQTVHISATVEAEGRAHTHVAVEFWDGDPRQGGQFIGGEMIPMILAGETATARVTWDSTGKGGARDIWVTVASEDTFEDLHHDNRAFARLHLPPPYLQYLPLARKES